MSSCKYIVGNEGFLKNVKYNKSEVTITWTTKLIEAKCYSGKSAINIIEKYNLNCWIWNPYEEKSIPNKYKVIQRNYFDCEDDTTHNVLEWIVVKEHIIESDVNYLINKKIKPVECYDYDEAIKIAKEKNIEMLKELSKKIGGNYLEFINELTKNIEDKI